MVAIAGGKPKLMGLMEIIDYYVDYQIKIVLRRTKFDLLKARERAHILEGLIIAVTNIDEVIKIIKTSPDTPKAKQNLRDAFDLSEKQAQAILDLRLARITKLEVNNLKDELAELKKTIAELQAIVDNKKLQKNVVKTEISAIRKKYRDDRRSEIVSTVEEISLAKKSEETKIENYVVGMNCNDVIRKVKLSTFKRYSGNETPNKAELFKFFVEADSTQTIYAFTNKGNCHKIDVELLPEASGAMSGGVKFGQFIKAAEKDELPVAFFAVNGVEVPSGRLIFYTSGGMVKVTPWSEYTVLKNLYQAIKLKEGDELIGVEEEIADSRMFFASKGGMCLYCEDEFPEQGRVAGGVKGMDLYDGDNVIYAGQVEKNKDYEILVATSFGTFKKVILGTINTLSRARKGVKLVDLGIEGEERAVFVGKIEEGQRDGLLIEDESGNISHLYTEDIASESRTTKGKTAVSLGIIRAKGVFPLCLKSGKK